MAFKPRSFAAIPLGNSISRSGHVIPFHWRSHEKVKSCFRVCTPVFCSGWQIVNATALPSSEMLTLDYRKVPFKKLGLSRLVSAQCTFNQAQHLYRQGEVTKREFDRYNRIWSNSTFRSNSKAQDQLFALGGQAAVERRYSRASNLHVAWRKKVLISIARDCLERLAAQK